jgi:hypothetical protein
MLLGLLHEGTDPFVDSGKSVSPFIGYQLAGEIGHFLLFYRRAKPYFHRLVAGESKLAPSSCSVSFWVAGAVSKNEKMSAALMCCLPADAATTCFNAARLKKLFEAFVRACRMQCLVPFRHVRTSESTTCTEGQAHGYETRRALLPPTGERSSLRI